MDLSVISNATTTAQSLSNLILVTPQSVVGYQPQSKTQPNGQPQTPPPNFVFNFEGRNELTYKSDITDHWAEDNNSLQDQIALKPIIVSTQGFIGELNDVPPAALRQLKSVSDKLTSIDAYAPSLSATALIAYTEAAFAYQTAINLYNSAVSAWNTTDGQGQNVISSNGIQISQNQNAQQKAFSQFFAYQNQRTLFTVQTPWCVVQDMAIDTLHPIQDEDTNMITTFEVTFKQLRFAQVKFGAANSGTLYDNTQFQGRTYMQGASLVDLGTSTPVPGPSLLAVV